MTCNQIETPAVTSSLASASSSSRGDCLRTPGETGGRRPGEENGSRGDGLRTPLRRITEAFRDAVCRIAAQRPESEVGGVVAEAMLQADVDWRRIPRDEIKRLVVDAVRAARRGCW